jgi:hypothetical protein
MLFSTASGGTVVMHKSDLVPEPTSRHLRIFAFDPSVSGRFDTASIGAITIAIPWEKDLRAGPVGEYLEVVDVDPASGVVYRPVDLNDGRLLAQDGLAPSEANPQFHQQMVYAVAMATIGHFEQALGRVALWSPHRPASRREEFVRRLRIYPHALRDRNAFYSPGKKALLFGYFPVTAKDVGSAPGTLVYTCLSHDIIAHEITHALLDGVHPRFNEPVNADVLAFHEAFADIVALFQHFAYPGVLRDQISRTRGDIAGEESFLGQLAQQFGKASGRGTALRDAIGRLDPVTGKWVPNPPDVHALQKNVHPHDRGAVLVAAVFGAFLKVYRARTLDLYRLASGGTGVLGAGAIHPDLAGRLADEAARTAQYVLQMCIRAIDYCPPVGLTFGDYLRGIVTADTELNPDDPYGYRLAFVESFRQWGVHAEGIRNVGTECYIWPTEDEAADEFGARLDRESMRSLFHEDQRVDRPEQIAVLQSLGTATGDEEVRLRPWDLQGDRYQIWKDADANAAVLWGWLMKHPDRARVYGIVLDEDGPPATVYRSRRSNRVAVEVHSVRRAMRRGPRGETVSDLVVEITQRRRGYFDPDEQKAKDKAAPDSFAADEKVDFKYRAGCTLLIDARTMQVRRVIRTRGTISDDDELARVRRFLTEGSEPVNAFARARDSLRAREPFALLHRHGEG